jgi:uncharacterized membrane protein YidH (DUF202 family)
MSKRLILLVIAALLVSVVGYLAWDRHDREIQKRNDRAFDAVFTRR